MDWTYEMLRYAFSWNDEGGHKAMLYVAECKGSVSSAKLQLIDTLLLFLLTEQDEGDRTSALIFLEEHAAKLMSREGQGEGGHGGGGGAVVGASENPVGAGAGRENLGGQRGQGQQKHQVYSPVAGAQQQGRNLQVGAGGQRIVVDEGDKDGSDRTTAGKRKIKRNRDGAPHDGEVVWSDYSGSDYSMSPGHGAGRDTRSRGVLSDVSGKAVSVRPGRSGGDAEGGSAAVTGRERSRLEQASGGRGMGSAYNDAAATSARRSGAGALEDDLSAKQHSGDASATAATGKLGGQGHKRRRKGKKSRRGASPRREFERRAPQTHYVDGGMLQKVFSVLENLLSLTCEEEDDENNNGSASTNQLQQQAQVSCPSKRGISYNFKCHVVTTYTSLLLQFDCLETNPERVEVFVALLFDVIADVNHGPSRMLRFYACEALHELEQWYHGLLFPFLGEEWFAFHVRLSQEEAAARGRGTTMLSSGGGQAGPGAGDPEAAGGGAMGRPTLSGFVHDERYHITEAYARLFFLTFSHFTKEVLAHYCHESSVGAAGSTVPTSAGGRGGYASSVGGESTTSSRMTGGGGGSAFGAPGGPQQARRDGSKSSSTIGAGTDHPRDFDAMSVSSASVSVRDDSSFRHFIQRDQGGADVHSFEPAQIKVNLIAGPGAGPVSHYLPGHGAASSRTSSVDTAPEQLSAGALSESEHEGSAHPHHPLPRQGGFAEGSLYQRATHDQEESSDLSYQVRTIVEPKLANSALHAACRYEYRLPRYVTKHGTDLLPPSLLYSDSSSASRVLPRRLIRLLTRAVSLVLETMPLSSSWTKIYFSMHLPFFSKHLALQTSVIYHHFLPLLHSSSAALLHALLAVTKAWWSMHDATSVSILDRLFSLVQDGILDPFFRGLCIQWLIALTRGQMKARILDRFAELAPRWQDPLELKELKLQFLLHALQCRRDHQMPRRLLTVLDALSEFKGPASDYGSDPLYARALGAQQVVFRFLLRVLILFPDHLERLGIPEYLCELLRSHPKLMPSVLAVIRQVPHQRIQLTLLTFLGQWTTTLLPTAKIAQYLGMLLVLAMVAEVEPRYVLASLQRLLTNDQKSRGLGEAPIGQTSWHLGMKILGICRQLMIHHPQSVLCEPLGSLLELLAKHHCCVDVRDRAVYYTRILYFVGASRMRELLQNSWAELEGLAGPGGQVLEAGEGGEVTDEDGDESLSSEERARGRRGGCATSSDFGSSDCSAPLSSAEEDDAGGRGSGADGRNSKRKAKRTTAGRNRKSFFTAPAAASYSPPLLSTRENGTYNFSDHTQSVVLPKTITLAGGPVPFLSFYKSLAERRHLGVLDGQCAIFGGGSTTAPKTHYSETSKKTATATTKTNLFDVGEPSPRSPRRRGEEQGAKERDLQLLQEDESDDETEIRVSSFREYLEVIERRSTKIKLPFRLQFLAPEAAGTPCRQQDNLQPERHAEAKEREISTEMAGDLNLSGRGRAGEGNEDPAMSYSKGEFGGTKAAARIISKRSQAGCVGVGVVEAGGNAGLRQSEEALDLEGDFSRSGIRNGSEGSSRNRDGTRATTTTSTEPLSRGQDTAAAPLTQAGKASALGGRTKMEQPVQTRGQRPEQEQSPDKVQPARQPSPSKVFVSNSSAGNAIPPDTTAFGSMPDEIYSLELRFSSAEQHETEYFVPLESLHVPFMKRPPSVMPSPTSATARDVANHDDTERATDVDSYEEFPHCYKVVLKIEVREPVLQIMDVNLTFSDRHGNTYFGCLESFAVSFQDLFLPVPRCFDVRKIFLLFWNQGDAFCEKEGNFVQSVKILFEPRALIHRRISSLLWPFLVPLEAVKKLPPEDFDFEQEQHFEPSGAAPARTAALADEWQHRERGPAPEAESDGLHEQNYGRHGATRGRGAGADGHGRPLNLETRCVLIFIPPRYHLALRWTISENTTVCRIRTDRFKLLSYLDTFFWGDFLKLAT